MNTVLVHFPRNWLSGVVSASRFNVRSGFKRALLTLAEWRRRHRVRSRLRTELIVMDVARIEKDAGLPTGALRHEASKPFWKA